MRVGRTVTRYVVGALILVVVICAGLVLRMVQFAHADGATSGDAIVVMGAAQYNGRPSSVFAARLDHAADIYRNGAAGHIVTVGGGRPGDRESEGEAGKQYLAQQQGIDPAALLAVPTGGDTLVSLRAANKAITARGWNSIVIVTDPWHEMRCRMIARDLGLAVQVSPVTQGPATADSVAARYMWRELLGSLFYRLVGGSSGEGTPVM